MPDFENAFLRVGKATGIPGDYVEVLVVGGTDGAEMGGVSLGIGHDPAQVEVVSSAPGKFLLDYAKTDLVFFGAPRNETAHIAIFALLDISYPITVKPVKIPAQTTLATITYRILPTAQPGTVVLRNEHRAFGRPNPVSNIYALTYGKAPIIPQLKNGEIVIAATRTEE